MKTQHQEMQNARRLESDLLVLAEKIADELRKPYSMRNVNNISTTWDQMAAIRPKTAKSCRILRKLKKPMRGKSSRSDYDVQREDYLYVQSMTKRLKLWKSMDLLIERHKSPVRVPLNSILPANSSDPVLAFIEKAFHKLANPQAQDEASAIHGCFADIPMPLKLFDALMSSAYRVSLVQDRAAPVRFLDVGCGGGTKVFAATRYFPEAVGLEYDPGYAKAAQQTMRVIKAKQCSIIHGDALTFESYGDYDVIYFYRPIHSDELLSAMQQRIIQNSRPGTILVAPYNTGFTTHRAMTCAQIDGPIFVAGLSQAEADQLNIDAQATDTDLLKRNADYRFETGFWAPILNTASFNGESQ